jgi:predicted TIM-barrel fold metal-dependent hydrolase
MERHNISHSILSCPIPLTILNLPSAAEIASLARETNAYLATLRDAHPSKFGFFATLPPLTDTEAAIAELKFALEDLKADGVILFTTYGDKYPGHPDFAPVWEELEEHKTVVFVHPTMEDMSNMIAEPLRIPRPIMDWTHETSRAALHLIVTDTRRKYPSVKVILSHGGGTLPYIAFRAGELSQVIGVGGKTADEIVEEARSFYFDTAFVGFEGPAQLLASFAKPGRVLFGSDFPFANDKAMEKQYGGVDKIEGLGNAVAELFPRLIGA